MLVVNCEFDGLGTYLSTPIQRHSGGAMTDREKLGNRTRRSEQAGASDLENIHKGADANKATQVVENRTSSLVLTSKAIAKHQKAQ